MNITVSRLPCCYNCHGEVILTILHHKQDCDSVELWLYHLSYQFPVVLLAHSCLQCLWLSLYNVYEIILTLGHFSSEALQCESLCPFHPDNFLYTVPCVFLWNSNLCICCVAEWPAQCEEFPAHIHLLGEPGGSSPQRGAQPGDSVWWDTATDTQSHLRAGTGLQRECVFMWIPIFMVVTTSFGPYQDAPVMVVLKCKSPVLSQHCF